MKEKREVESRRRSWNVPKASRMGVDSRTCVSMVAFALLCDEFEFFGVGDGDDKCDGDEFGERPPEDGEKEWRGGERAEVTEGREEEGAGVDLDFSAIAAK